MALTPLNFNLTREIIWLIQELLSYLYYNLLWSIYKYYMWISYISHVSKLNSIWKYDISKENCIFNIILKVKRRFRIWKNNYIYFILSIYTSCGWTYFSHKMVVEMVFNNEMQFWFSNQFIFLKGKKYSCVHYWKKLKLNFNIIIWTKS